MKSVVITKLFWFIFILLCQDIWVISFHFKLSRKFLQPLHNHAKKVNQPNKPPRLMVSPRVQRIKDMTIQKLILNDITTSEFALSLTIKSDDKKIDYEKLIEKLNYDLNLLNDRHTVRDKESLIDRIIKTKEDLSLVLNNQPPRNLHNLFISNTTTTSKPYEKNNLIQELRESLIFVREDGTVDWDGALASSKEVARVGAELLERLNGKEETASFADLFTQVQVNEPQTETIIKLSNKLNQAKKSLEDIKSVRDTLKETIRNDRNNNKPLNESNIASLRQLEVRVKELTKWTQVLQLDFDIERICVYLEQEIESSVDPNEQRNFVAEVALVDKQFSALVSTLILEPSNQTTFKIDPITQFELQSVTEDEFISLIDDDELNLLIGEVNDLKNRLGLDTQSSKVNWGSLGVVVSENLAKLRAGISFYGDGVKLFFKDLSYGWTLLIRAAQGAMLKPREVNAIRRIGKDLLGLIPFTIILIVPLTPVGHVLAFSLLQKFFPDFFPSFFTEKRLNLKKLFSEIESKGEYDGLDEILGQDDNNNNIFISTSKDLSNNVINTFNNFFQSIKSEIISLNNNKNDIEKSNNNTINFDIENLSDRTLDRKPVKVEND